MSKPHLVCIQLIWYCIKSRTTLGADYGMGFNPSDAYIDWRVRRGAA